MEERITKMQQRILKVMTEEFQGLINDFLKDTLDPSRLMQFISSIGIDISQIPGIITQQPSFDPYQVLGLDPTATDEEIDKRYKDIMSKIHPDRAGKEMNFLASIVNTAYELIRKRRRV